VVESLRLLQFTLEGPEILRPQPQPCPSLTAEGFMLCRRATLVGKLRWQLV